MQDLQISQDEFEAWQKGFATTAVLNVLLAHASELKISLLNGYWETNNPEDQEAIAREKEAVKARIEVIRDIADMKYENFISYFKTE